LILIDLVIDYRQDWTSFGGWAISFTLPCLWNTPLCWHSRRNLEHCLCCLGGCIGWASDSVSKGHWF